VERLPRQFWCGLLAGVGLGLTLAAALAEWGLLSAEGKTVASVAGLGLLLLGAVLAYRTQKDKG
jgi:hypothetical protein